MDREPGNLSLPTLRFIGVQDPIQNCGLRRIGVRRSTTDSGAWEVFVSVHNYTAAPPDNYAGVKLRPVSRGAGQSHRSAHNGCLWATRRRSGNQFCFLRTRAAGFLQAQLFAA